LDIFPVWRLTSCASDTGTSVTCVFVDCAAARMSDSTLLLVAFFWPMSTATTTSNGEVHSKRSKMSALMVVTGPDIATKTAVRDLAAFPPRDREPCFDFGISHRSMEGRSST
jgi:hypothetical protein